jgi:DNA-directed RNA polymerase subunit RPC12/RpoP
MKYTCKNCGDTVIEPKASGEWDCVVCGGRMKQVRENDE